MSSRVRKKIRLGVNIDHAATLRQVRGATTSYPDLVQVMDLAVQGGADQITIHLREDRRHIQDRDVELLSKKTKVPLNLEMAVTEEMIQIALRNQPEIVCLVPEKRRELTTEGGLDVKGHVRRMGRATKRLREAGIEVSPFIDPSVAQVKACAEIGVDAVELHTGSWVLLKGEKKRQEWQRLKKAAICAHELGLRVHAGHGLDFQTARHLAQRLPYLEELNIGHSLICYSLEMGLKKAVREMKKSIRI